MTKVRIPPTLRAEVGGEREVEATGETMREVLDDLAARYPGLGSQLLSEGDIAPFVNVYVDNEDVRTLQGLETPVRDSSTVILLPAMAGGQVPTARPTPVVASLLDLVGGTPLVELSRLTPNPNVKIYAKLEGQNPTGSIKDRVAKAMIENAEASGELAPGRELLEPTSGNTGISLAMVAKLKGYSLTCVMPESATAERIRLLELFGAKVVFSPGEEGSNGAVRKALSMAERDPRYYMPFQYANEANPRAHYEGTGAEIAEALPRVDAFIAGLGTGGTLMGCGERLRESFPDVQIVAARASPGRPDLRAALARRRLRPADPRRLEARPEDPRHERGVGRRPAHAARARRDLRRSLVRGRRPRRPPDRERVGRRRDRNRARRRGLEVPLRRLLDAAARRGRAVDGGSRLVVIPALVRSELTEHAEAEQPNEACGLIALRDGVAERYLPARNAAASPYRFELDVDPEAWFLEDEGYELAVFHSHLSSPPRPSRTDVENIGLWEGRPYVILTVRTGELAAWRIRDSRIEPEPLGP